MTKIRRVFALFVLLVVCAPARARGAEKLWKAGFAAVEITPTESVWLAGYGARTKPSEGVAHPIYSKALALEDTRGTRLVIITTDILGFTPALTGPIAERLARKPGLRRSEILFTSSHTHTAPVVRDYAVFAYGLTPEQEAAVERFSQRLVERTVEAVQAAWKDRAPARLSYGRGKAGFLVNRRVLAARGGVSFGSNDAGPVDPEVPVLKIEGRDGKLRGVLFGFACHNTTLTGDFYRVSGDYAGYAQSTFEAEHPGARAQFVAGFAGDANPNPRGKLEQAVQYGRELAQAVGTVLAQPMQPVAGDLRVAFDHVALPFAPPPSREELEARLKDKDLFRQRNARRMLDILAREGKLPSSYPDPVHVAQFGRTFTLIALGGEVVVDYSLRLRRELAANPLFLVAYANDVFAYIPSVRILKEGGYEGGGSMIFYGRPGPWAEEVEEVLVRKIKELVARVVGVPGARSGAAAP